MVYIDDNVGAVLFGIDKDLYIESFLGSVFSGKKHFSKSSAIRGGISLALNADKAESGSALVSEPVEPESKNELLNYSITLSFDYLKYFNSTSRVFFFAGVGPQISYFWEETTYYKKENNSFWNPNRESQRNKWSIGIHTTLGIECFLAQNISLLAEYGLSFVYDMSKKEYHTIDSSKSFQETEAIRIQPHSTRLGVSFYF